MSDSLSLAASIASAIARINSTDPADPHNAMRSVVRELGGLLDAPGGFAVLIGRTAKRDASPLQGWRPRAIVYVHPEAFPIGAILRSVIDDPLQFARDPHVDVMLNTAGTLRTYLRDDIAKGERFENSVIGRLAHTIGATDRVMAMIPIAEQAEFMVALDRYDGVPFDESHRELLRATAPGAVEPARRMCLTFGLLPGQTPLSPREREVVGHLLGSGSTKEIAAAVGLTPRSTSQVVVSIYRKLRVSSRAELTSLWLSPAAE